MSLTIIVVGGGAAGFFGAITCAQTYPEHQVILLEKTRQPLAKVKISGGGRCNVTHACFDPAVLVRSYPRGGKELRGPFSRFQPKDTIEWFKSRDVELVAEEDGRMFPITNQSETIIKCLQQEAQRNDVEIKLECGVQAITKENNQFHLLLTNGETLKCDRLLMATGSAPKLYPILEGFGHTAVPSVPSLFTFNVPSSPLLDLAGISFPAAKAVLPHLGLEQTGPLLITHWGFSGPAILKLSAWGARALHEVDYQTLLEINWVPDLNENELQTALMSIKNNEGSRQLGSESLFCLPRQLWKRLIQIANIDPDMCWSQLSKKQFQDMIKQLHRSTFKIEGKTTYKQEFVTAGGISLEEVNFKTMESRCCPGLYFAGEILNIDGITGGFNFQNAWTTGWIAGKAIGLI